MNVTPKLIKQYLYNPKSLKKDIELLNVEIEDLRNNYTTNEALHPLQASVLSDMPKAPISQQSKIESFLMKRNSYLQCLILEELQLRALYISINIVVNRLQNKEKDVFNKKYNEKTKHEIISKACNFSVRYIQALDKKIIDKIKNMYLEKIKCFTC
jgi:hypothetical protein